jgi:hypothetical protein
MRSILTESSSPPSTPNNAEPGRPPNERDGPDGRLGLDSQADDSRDPKERHERDDVDDPSDDEARVVDGKDGAGKGVGGRRNEVAVLSTEERRGRRAKVSFPMLVEDAPMRYITLQLMRARSTSQAKRARAQMKGKRDEPRKGGWGCSKRRSAIHCWAPSCYPIDRREICFLPDPTSCPILLRQKLPGHANEREGCCSRSFRRWSRSASPGWIESYFASASTRSRQGGSAGPREASAVVVRHGEAANESCESKWIRCAWQGRYCR